MVLSDPEESVSSAEVKIPTAPSRPPQGDLNPEKISLSSIRDAATYVSLPEASRKILESGGGEAARVNTANTPENTLCDECHVFKSVCSCKKQCAVCQEWTDNDKDCRCTIEYISVLKARIEKNLADDSNEITLDKQADISAVIDERFDAFSLTPPEIKSTVNLLHVLDPNARELVEK